jgi:hypothetical protein
MIECPKCKNSNAVKGHLASIGKSSQLTASFWPEAVKWHQFIIDHGPVIQREAFACPDCGMVWSAIKDITDLHHILSQAGKTTESRTTK